MIEFDVDVPAPDGQIPCFVAMPDGGGPFPSVILQMDAPGIREELRNFTRRIAKQGYVCILPDMYYRAGTLRFDMGFKSEKMLPLMLAAMATIDIEKIMNDMSGVLAWLDAQAETTGKVGVVGFCMSGQYVAATAAHFPNHIAAGASMYGVSFVTDQPDSPHLKAKDIKGELYLAFAGHDPWVPDEQLKAVRKYYKAPHTIEVYPGTEHGYAFPLRPAYDQDAAEKSWKKVFALFERKLKGKAPARKK